MKPPNSGHPKQQTYLEQRAKQLVSNVTAFFKLPTNRGHLSITDKFFKTRRCPLFRGFTVLNDWKHDMDNRHNNFFLRRQGKGNRLIYFLIRKLSKHISRSNIERIDFDPTFSHIKKVKEVLEKCLKNIKYPRNWNLLLQTAMPNLGRKTLFI